MTITADQIAALEQLHASSVMALDTTLRSEPRACASLNNKIAMHLHSVRTNAWSALAFAYRLRDAQLDADIEITELTQGENDE